MVKEILSCKIEPEAKKLLEDLAKKDQRTLSSYIKHVLLDHLKAKGFDIAKYRKSKQLDLF
jgi:hypothetical protein